jgi:hypothetical protein
MILQRQIQYIWRLHLPDVGEAGVKLPSGAGTLDKFNLVAAEDGARGGEGNA